MNDSNDTIVVVKDLYKSFRLPHEQHSGIKQLLLNVFRRSSKRVLGYETQHVLNDISFEIKKGEFFGIVGRNGSGKSTLLKLLAGIYAPDRGLVQVNGSLTPFIELGVGFNPELTGRENVYLNGALLGFSHDEMDDMYEDIVAFAELEKFMDQKLKNYSSGMQVRLAFSIAIRAKSDIILLDEVLAVGDEAFQRKCYSYFERLKREKGSVIIVTHDMSVVEKFCTRALLVDNGHIKMIGSPHDVASAYSEQNSEAYTKSKDKEGTSKRDKKKETVSLALSDADGVTAEKYTSGDVMTVSLKWEDSKVQNVGVAIISQAGEYIYGTNTFVDSFDIKGKSIEYKVRLDVTEGDYFLMVATFGQNDKVVIDVIDHAADFTVNRNTDDSRWEGMAKLKSEWR